MTENGHSLSPLLWTRAPELLIHHAHLSLILDTLPLVSLSAKTSNKEGEARDSESDNKPNHSLFLSAESANGSFVFVGK